MKFTIDIEKKDVEPLNLFFHSWEHDGKKIDTDPGVVQKLGIAVRNAIRSVLFVPIESINDLKEKATSKTKYSIEMTLNDAMLIVGAFSPNSKFCDGRMAEKAKEAIGRMETQVDQLVEGLDNEAEGRFHQKGTKMFPRLKRWHIIKGCGVKRLTEIEEMEGYHYIHFFTGFSFRNWAFGILYRTRKEKIEKGD